MSRAGMLHGALHSLFEGSESGSMALHIIGALFRQLLAKDVLNRGDIIEIVERLEERARFFNEPGELQDNFTAADFQTARSSLLEMLNRDPGLDIKTVEPDITALVGSDEAAKRVRFE